VKVIDVQSSAGANCLRPNCRMRIAISGSGPKLPNPPGKCREDQVSVRVKRKVKVAGG
jgi:hypothetical protein